MTPVLHVEHWGLSLSDTRFYTFILCKVFPRLSPAFFINSLLNKAYCHRPNFRFCLYDLLTHADLLIKRPHLLCLLLSGQPVKICICRNAFSFPISLLLTVFVSSLSNIGYPFPKRFFTGLNLFRSIKHILPAKRLKLAESFELSDGIYGFVFDADKLLDSAAISSDFAYLLYEMDHFNKLGINGFPEIKYTGASLKIIFCTRMGGINIVCNMVNDWLNYTRKKDSYSVLARKEFEKKFEEDLAFYSDASIKEMIELYE